MDGVLITLFILISKNYQIMMYCYTVITFPKTFNYVINAQEISPLINKKCLNTPPTEFNQLIKDKPIPANIVL